MKEFIIVCVIVALISGTITSYREITADNRIHDKAPLYLKTGCCDHIYEVHLDHEKIRDSYKITDDDVIHKLKRTGRYYYSVYPRANSISYNEIYAYISSVVLELNDHQLKSVMNNKYVSKVVQVCQTERRIGGKVDFKSAQIDSQPLFEKNKPVCTIK